MVQTPSIPYFKGLDMRNLQYEIRICQKSHNKVTMTVYVMVRFLMKQTLCISINHSNVQLIIHMVVSLLVMQVVHPAFIPTLLKLTRIHWLIGLSLNEAKTFLKVPVSIKVVTPGPRIMRIQFLPYTTSQGLKKS